MQTRLLVHMKLKEKKSGPVGVWTPDLSQLIFLVFGIHEDIMETPRLS